MPLRPQMILAISSSVASSANSMSFFPFEAMILFEPRARATASSMGNFTLLAMIFSLISTPAGSRTSQALLQEVQPFLW